MKKEKTTNTSKPIILNLAKVRDRRVFQSLKKRKKIQTISDDYEEQLREWFGIKNPSLVYVPTFEEKFQNFKASIIAKKSLKEHGRWVYYPWLAAVTHILPESDFQLVRTARNQNLITSKEQSLFYNATIGIAGLSVGSSVAIALALQGGGRHLKLADHDRLALTNTNRIRAGVQNLGLLKTEMIARQIYEINPYVTIELFSDGLGSNNIKQFFSGLDIVIDEIDNLAMKYLIRDHAKKNRIAVVMGADNGDNAVVDVERYDLNPRTRYFHGRMGNVTYNQLAKLDKFGIGKMITKHVGPENVTEAMQQSLLVLGKAIVSWPQLGGAALLNGAAVAYCVRKILNGQPVESNRAIISLDEKLTPDYDKPAMRKRRRKTADAFRKIFGL